MLDRMKNGRKKRILENSAKDRYELKWTETKETESPLYTDESKGRKPVLVIEVSIKSNVNKSIYVYHGDKAREIAKRFAKKHRWIVTRIG